MSEARAEVWYEVWPERRRLVRFVGDRAEIYCAAPNGDEWMPANHLNEIRYGRGDSIWYDTIDEREAKEWMKKFREMADRDRSKKG